MNTNLVELWILEREGRDFKYFNLLHNAQQLRFKSLKGKRQSEFGFTRLLLNHIVKQKLSLEVPSLNTQLLNNPDCVTSLELSESPERINSLELVDSLEREESLELVESPEPMESIEQTNLPPLIPIFEANGWLFSISHSADMIAIAVMQPKRNQNDSHAPRDNLLGLDVECLHKPRKLSAATVFCNEQQLHTLASLTDGQSQKNYFTRLWTQKEAYFKARRLPILNKNLKGLSFIQNKTNTNQPSDLQSTLYKSHKLQDYQLSVYHNSPAKIELRLANVTSDGEVVDRQGEDICWETFSSL